jgi:arabinogalactan endo-1,4-beta-galactosidase
MLFSLPTLIFQFPHIADLVTLALSMLLLAALPFFVAAASTALTNKGVDWSSLLVEEAAGKTYKNAAGTTQPLETILEASGVNTVRQRTWVNPVNGTYGLDYNLELAKRATAAGLDIYLDFHFSDTWADPGHQTTPAAWQGFDIDDLADEIYNYTMDTMDSFQTNGVPLSLVSIGNEITAGMLWPLGEFSDNAYNLARLLHSASAGIKDSNILPQPAIMIHLDNGWNYQTQENWYDTVLAEGPLASSDFDVQGVSYYPFYNSAATLASLQSSLTSMKNKYEKQVMVVETNWPTSCPDPEYAFPSDTTSIPFSPAGQTTWIEDVASEVSAAGGNGLFYWEPAWIDNAGLGSSCDYNLQVDDTGMVLSSMAVYASI